jgi:tetrapyrrole methylase family protein/MazG family protein
MSGRVVVVGLGPADVDLITVGARDEIARHDVRFVRTDRHPAARAVPGAATFDGLYESADTMRAVYRGIVDTLADAAAIHGEILYAVPGSPMVAEHTVELLLADDRVEVRLVPALSFLDLAWVRLGVDPIAAGVRVVDGHRFAVEAAGSRGPLLVAQCDRRSVLSDVKLAIEDPPDEVVVLSGLGTDREAIFPLSWADLDRDLEPDHLTSLWIPTLDRPVAAAFVAFDELVARLRQECPWDREQTHRTLARFVVEEAYEVVDVLDRMPVDAGAIGSTEAPARDAVSDGFADVDDLYTALEEELGDLLFQVVLHARLGAEAGRFDLVDVVAGIHDKLVTRHPHVFGDVEVDGDARQVEANWERIKGEERTRASAYDGIPGALPALARGAELLERARRLGATVGGTPSPDRPDDALGERLLSLVDEAVAAGVDPEGALRAVNRRVEEELRAAEAGG